MELFESWTGSFLSLGVFKQSLHDHLIDDTVKTTLMLEGRPVLSIKQFLGSNIFKTVPLRKHNFLG